MIAGTPECRYLPIGDYGIIGDQHTVALVSTSGSIDFLCFPTFDSPSVFLALLDAEDGGRFRIAPLGDAFERKQLYLPDTNVLMTRFLAEDGVAEVVDFMPAPDMHQARTLIRQVRVVRGEVKLRALFAPRFDYGRAEHEFEAPEEGQILVHSSGGDGRPLRLRHSVPIEIDGRDAIADFTLSRDETAEFVLEHANLCDDSRARCDADYVAERFDATCQYWRAWIAKCKYDGRWRETVRRSALTLKLCTSRKYGSIVAAPTFGLPEELGGSRNWDYRYSWIRDSAFTLYALMRLGYADEAKAFMGWLQDLCSHCRSDGEPPLKIMYSLDGTDVPEEKSLEHLEGYRRSAPVRIGNGAAGQLQLDIYGELLDSVYLYNKYGEPIGYDFWQQLSGIIDWVCDNWQQRDEGIWETRGGSQHHAYSRLMCWVAVDRGLRLAENRSFPAPRNRWYEARDSMYSDLFENFWNDDVGAFVQARGSRQLDASLLIMPLVKFIGPTDPRWLSTLEAIERELVHDSLVYRYTSDDGLPGEEGTFNMCTFWYAECLARAGRIDKARLVFEKMLGYANHLGLYAEQLAKNADQLGNFPQAFTHLAQISAAWRLNELLDEAGRQN